MSEHISKLKSEIRHMQSDLEKVLENIEKSKISIKDLEASLKEQEKRAAYLAHKIRPLLERYEEEGGTVDHDLLGILKKID